MEKGQQTNTTSAGSRRPAIPAWVGAVVLSIALAVACLATWALVERLFRPGGEQWVREGGAEVIPARHATLFLDRKIVPLVQVHYRDKVDDWGGAITEILGVAPNKHPAIYLFYDREAFSRYARGTSHSTRAFYDGKNHEIYLHGNFLGGQLENLDEEGTLAHELTHARLRESLGEIPVWLDEGLAHFMQQGCLEGGKWFEGIPPMEQINAVFDALDAGRLPSLDRFVLLKPGPYYRRKHLGRGMSAFLVMYLHEKGCLGDFLAELKRSADSRRPRAVAALLEKACGKSLADIDADLVAYLESRDDLEAFGEGLLRATVGLHDEAIPYYRRAVAVDSANGLFWDRLGLSLELAEADGNEVERSDEAFAAYRRAASADPFPGQATTLIIVGNGWFERGQLLEARTAYERALRRRLPNPMILHRLALTYRDEDPGKARKLVDEALALPRDGAFYANRFKELEELRRSME